MNHKLIFIVLILIEFFCLSQVQGQDRYTTKVFSEVEVEQNIEYAQNFTILKVGLTGHSERQRLLMDIYQPKNDTETERPLIIYMHTGSFLPFPQNGLPYGSKNDLTSNLICTRLAELGYVVASIDYRLGWNPFLDDQQQRKAQLINAAFRGVQDANTAIRFFKKSVAVENNTYGIDTSKITLFGNESGGYISLAASAMDDNSDLYRDAGGQILSKFYLNIVGRAPIKMVQDEINGNFAGTNIGIVPNNYALGLAEGDTLCVPNHVGYSSQFQLSVNIAGAMGDSSWYDSNDVPIISVHAPYDHSSPYGTDVLTVQTPTTELKIVEVSGSHDVQKIALRNGNNHAFANVSWKDKYSEVAANANEGMNGLYPIYGSKLPAFDNDEETDSSPWQYWDEEAYCLYIDGYNEFIKASGGSDLISCQGVNARAKIYNPDQSLDKSNRYLDTIIQHFAPRACLVLGLNCNLTPYISTVSSEQIDLEAYNVRLAPNPATSSIKINAEELIRSVSVYSVTGKKLQTENNINRKEYILNKDKLNTGLYIVQLKFKDGIINKKIIFTD